MDLGHVSGNSRKNLEILKGTKGKLGRCDFHTQTYLKKPLILVCSF